MQLSSKRSVNVYSIGSPVSFGSLSRVPTIAWYPNERVSECFGHRADGFLEELPYTFWLATSLVWHKKYALLARTAPTAFYNR